MPKLVPCQLDPTKVCVWKLRGSRNIPFGGLINEEMFGNQPLFLRRSPENCFPRPTTGRLQRVNSNCSPPTWQSLLWNRRPRPDFTWPVVSPSLRCHIWSATVRRQKKSHLDDQRQGEIRAGVSTDAFNSVGAGTDALRNNREPRGSFTSNNGKER